MAQEVGHPNSAISPASKKRVAQRKWPGLLALLFPSWMWWMLLWGVPYVWLFTISLWRLDFAQLQWVPDWNVDNYRDIFTNSLYYGTILKTIRISGTEIFLCVLIGFPLAYFIAFKARNKTLWYTLVVLPIWISYLIRIWGFRLILGREGVLNSTLLSLHLISHPLSTILFSQTAIIIATTSQMLPFVTFSIYLGLEKLPPALIEASKDLGAARFETFRRITFPLALPGLIVGVTYAWAIVLGDFVAPALVGGTDGQLVASLLIGLFGASLNWPLGAALAVVLLLMIMPLLFIGRMFERKEQIFLVR